MLSDREGFCVKNWQILLASSLFLVRLCVCVCVVHSRARLTSGLSSMAHSDVRLALTHFRVSMVTLAHGGQWKAQAHTHTTHCTHSNWLPAWLVWHPLIFSLPPDLSSSVCQTLCPLWITPSHLSLHFSSPLMLGWLKCQSYLTLRGCTLSQSVPKFSLRRGINQKCITIFTDGGNVGSALSCRWWKPRLELKSVGRKIIGQILVTSKQHH